MNWSLKYKQQRKSFSAWGLSRVKRTCANQVSDRLTFVQEGANVDAADLFKPESHVSVYREDSLWFQGLVVRTPGMGSPLKEEKRYVIEGPWWYLDNLVYQQSWARIVALKEEAKTLETIHTGRVVLGQDFKGNAISSGAQIEAIVHYAIAQGAPIRLGTVGVSVNFPYDEAKDLSCAEAIQRLLRWSPDAVLWFDYTTKPFATLHVTRRFRMRAHNLDLDGSQSIKNISITPRYDLQSSAVVIKYEKNNISDKDIWTTTEVDAYPEHATGREFKALVLTIELDGSLTQHIKQPVKTAPILEYNSQWWQEHLPALQGIPSANIKLNDVSRKSALPMELLEGSIASWMNEKVEEDVIKAKISYETENEWVVDREVSVRLHATTAETRAYRQLLTASASESTPEGLAKKLYNAVSPLHYEGEITLVDEDVSSTYMGTAINIVGACKDWSTMNAVVQSVREDVEKGCTVIKFGPPKQLGADDMVELLRVNRKRVASQSASKRTLGKALKQNILEQSTHSRLESTDSGSGSLGRMVFCNPENPHRKIILDTKAIEEDIVITLREEDVCENGFLKKRLVLASNPYGDE